MNQNKIEHDIRGTKDEQYLVSENLKNNIANIIVQKDQNEKCQDQKSICQKYLNVFESINKKQNINNGQKGSKKLIKGYKLLNHKRTMIFENSVIKNTCSTTSPQINAQKSLYNENEQISQKSIETANFNGFNKDIKGKFVHNNRKNDISIQMIAEFKYQQQQKPKMEDQSLKVNGKQIFEQLKNKTMKYVNFRQKVTANDKKSSFCINENFLKAPTSKNLNKSSTSQTKLNFHRSYHNFLSKNREQWCKNIFQVQTKNGYSGYYKEKTTKKYCLQVQKVAKKRNFVDSINKTIIQKQRRKQIRPQSSFIQDKSSFQNDVEESKYGKEERLLKIPSQPILKAKSIQRFQNIGNDVKKVSYYGIVQNNSRVRFLYNGQQSPYFQRKNSPRQATFHIPAKTLMKPRHRNNLSFDQFHHTNDKQNLKIISQNFYEKCRLNKKSLLKKVKEQIQKTQQKVNLNRIQDCVQNDVQLMIRQIIPADQRYMRV